MMVRVGIYERQMLRKEAQAKMEEFWKMNRRSSEESRMTIGGSERIS